MSVLDAEALMEPGFPDPDKKIDEEIQKRRNSGKGENGPEIESMNASPSKDLEMKDSILESSIAAPEVEEV